MQHENISFVTFLLHHCWVDLTNPSYLSLHPAPACISCSEPWSSPPAPLQEAAGSDGSMASSLRTAYWIPRLLLSDKLSGAPEWSPAGGHGGHYHLHTHVQRYEELKCVSMLGWLSGAMEKRSPSSMDITRSNQESKRAKLAILSRMEGWHTPHPLAITMTLDAHDFMSAAVIVRAERAIMPHRPSWPHGQFYSLEFPTMDGPIMHGVRPSKWWGDLTEGWELVMTKVGRGGGRRGLVVWLLGDFKRIQPDKWSFLIWECWIPREY